IAARAPLSVSRPNGIDSLAAEDAAIDNASARAATTEKPPFRNTAWRATRAAQHSSANISAAGLRNPIDWKTLDKPAGIWGIASMEVAAAKVSCWMISHRKVGCGGSCAAV